MSASAGPNIGLLGFGVAGYRSFGSMVRVGPLSKVHLVAGANNSGKSNLLRAVQAALPALKADSVWTMSRLDVPVAAGDDEVPPTVVELAVERKRVASLISSRAAAFLDQPAFERPSSDGLAWLAWRAAAGIDGRFAHWRLDDDQATAASKGHFRDEAMGLCQELTQGYSSEAPANVAAVLGHIDRVLGIRSGLPEVATIEAFRQVTLDDSGEGPYSGAGLISRLAALQNPDPGDERDLEKFESINRFLSTVLEDPRARIEIPFGRATILFNDSSGKRLPLENLGTGLHQAVIIAAAATLLDRTIVCIEEPELHLHPVLQRKLLRYLATETTNQYVVATHSAHFLDLSIASISRVSQVGGRSLVTPAVLPKDIAAIGGELGYRASDLVQANAVVWVEGPSDRVYLRCWIEAVDQRLTEGVHYSIMFYGGSTLSHLAPSDPTVGDFIALRRLNRNLAIVIDSDRTSADSSINATKERIVESFEEGEQGTAWVTSGYTIENYVPRDLLVAAVETVHPLSGFAWGGDMFSNPLAKENCRDRESALDKVAIAAEVVNNAVADTQWNGDQTEQIDALVRMIRRVNDLPEPS